MIASSIRVLVLLGISLLLVFACLSFLGALGSAGIIILAAILIAYLILPAVHYLKNFMPVLAAVAITYVAFAILVAAAIFIVVPPLVDQARGLIVATPALVSRLTLDISDPNNRLLARLPAEVRAYLIGIPSHAIASVSTYGVIVAQRTLGVLLSTVSILLSLIIVPILAAYLFFETGDLRRAAIGFVPQRARPKTLAIAFDLSDAIGAFVRGQVLDGAIVGVMIATMLWFMHVPYALLIGVAAGFLNLVPYLGAIAGFIPSVLLALGYNGWQNALVVALLFGIIQQIDGSFILPRIMKANVSLSPVVIIVSILVGSALFGVVGTFLAVPVAAMLRVIKIHFAPSPSPREMSALEKSARTLTIFE
jgi:predicted PurR-regulated permease PerM